MTQEVPKNHPSPIEGRENIISPEETAERLYHLGFRLSAPLSTQLTDTHDEIVLSNIHASFLSKCWADGVDRGVEEFYPYLGIPEDEEVADLLFQKSQEEREPDPAGKEKLARFLLEKGPRQAWGEFTCYLALAEVGSQPWQWIPEEMVEQIAAELKDRSTFSWPYGKEEAADWIVNQPEISQEIVTKVLIGHCFPRDEEVSRTTKLISEFDDRYPERTEEVVKKIEGKPDVPVNQFTYLLGPEIIKRLAEKKYPKWQTTYNQWMGYQATIHGKEFDVFDDEGAIRSRDERLVIKPPCPVFLAVHGYFEFQTKEAIDRDLEDTNERIKGRQQELKRLKERRKWLESLS